VGVTLSLGETQELMRTMQQLMALLNGIETKATKLNAEVPKIQATTVSFQQLERVALRYLVLTRQMGLPDEVNKTIQVITKMIILIRMATMALNSMVGGPIGIAMGVASFAMIGLSAPTLLEGY
jgi:hypothetical protein